MLLVLICKTNLIFHQKTRENHSAFLCLMKGEEEQESEQSGEEGAEEEGTESDLVGTTIFTQVNCADNV